MSGRPDGRERGAERRDERQVTGGQRARSDEVHVVLDGGPRGLLRRLEERPDVDVEAQVGERRRDDLLPAVVPVLPHLRDEDARATSLATEERLRPRRARAVTAVDVSPTSPLYTPEIARISAW